ncbi:kynureninase, partial [Bacteroidota bacterium]
NLPRRLGSKIAKIIGAGEDEVFVTDSTSLNLYKLIFGALSFKNGRNKIISDSMNFPSDLYIIQGLIEQQFTNHSLELIRSNDGISPDLSELENKLDDNTALITLSHVTFKSSYKYDIESITKSAHEHDSLVLWDLSHSAGITPVDLKNNNVDLAVGCTYKYLNGGPGAPAYLYVREDLQDKIMNPIWGWFGHKNPFEFNKIYTSGEGIEKYSVGTPPVLSIAAIEPGLDIILDAGIEKLRDKSVTQSEFLIELINEFLIPLKFSIGSPIKSENRGSHISIQHPEGYRINRAMIEPGNNSKIIIPDFRPPDNIRLGIAPLYNSFMQLYESVIRIRDIVIEKEYLNHKDEKLAVT